MHVGTSVIFQNPGHEVPDRTVYQNELKLADLAEPLGFESIWSVEHHFTDYTMCPDVLQFLTYMAGRTEKVQLGSMVVVLPWHDPLRVAEQISMLDNISDGRMILGLGRGAGRVEFDGFRLDMGESRQRFTESARMLIEGLESGYCELDGDIIKQPRVAIRPEPFKSFKGRIYAAAVSPESARIMAELGVGLLIVPQKPWDDMVRELDDYRAVYRDVNGIDAPPPMFATWTICHEDEKQAYEMGRRYIGGYWQTILDHYKFHTGHLKGQKGYEYYGKFADSIQKVGDDSALDFFMNLQVWGTPEMCFEKIVSIADRVGSDSFIGIFSMAGMPADDAERNMRLFASEVMPKLQALPPASERARHVA